MTDRAYGEEFLRKYQRASLLPATYSLAKYFDEKSPGLIEIWGRMVKLVRQDKLDAQIGKLARKLGMATPSRADLNQVILDSGPDVDFSQAVKEGLADTAKGVALFAGAGLGVYLIILLIPFILSMRAKHAAAK